MENKNLRKYINGLCDHMTTKTDEEKKEFGEKLEKTFLKYEQMKTELESKRDKKDSKRFMERHDYKKTLKEYQKIKQHLSSLILEADEISISTNVYWGASVDKEVGIRISKMKSSHELDMKEEEQEKQSKSDGIHKHFDIDHEDAIRRAANPENQAQNSKEDNDQEIGE